MASQAAVTWIITQRSSPNLERSVAWLPVHCLVQKDRTSARDNFCHALSSFKFCNVLRYYFCTTVALLPAAVTWPLAWQPLQTVLSVVHLWQNGHWASLKRKWVWQKVHKRERKTSPTGIRKSEYSELICRMFSREFALRLFVNYACKCT